jgi:hypothetical protein
MAHFLFHISHPDTWDSLKLDTAKVLIKGASIAGLTAAARLKKSSGKSEIFECHIDGEIYQNTKIAGYEFDYAPLFSLPATFRDFFQKTGKHFGQVLNVEPKDPAFVFRFEDLEINFANLSHSARMDELRNKLGDTAAKEWELLIKSGEYFWDRLRENYLEWEFSFSRANIPIYLKLRAPYIQNPYLKRIVAHYATYFGYPAGIYKWSTMVAFAEESFGIWQIKGGIGALTEALKLRALDLGVRFEKPDNYDYLIECEESFSRPTQRLIGIKGYPHNLPVRTVIFHKSGLTTDIYATEKSSGNYSLVLTGKLDISEFDQYSEVDQIRPAIQGSGDNRLLTKIRTASKRNFKVRHLDSLAHGAIAGELLANALRGIKNRPSHEH